MSDDTAKGRTPTNHLDTEARHVVDMAHALLDEAHAAEGPLVERVRNALQCLENAKYQIGRLEGEAAATNAVLDDIGARIGPLADRVKSFGSETDDFTKKLRSEIERARAERDAIKADRDSLLATDAAMVGELVDVLGNACLPSDIVGRVRGVLAQVKCRTIERDDAESSVARVRQDRDKAYRERDAAIDERDALRARLDGARDDVNAIAHRARLLKDLLAAGGES